MLYYGCMDLGRLIVTVYIFLKHNGLCGRLVDSNYFYPEGLIPCTNFCVYITPFAYLLHTVITMHAICEGQFLPGLEDLLSNKLCSEIKFTIILGDLNARSPEWWSKDIATLHSTQIDSLTITHGFKQLISDSTHIQPVIVLVLFNFDRSTKLSNWLLYTTFFTS